MEFLQNPKVQNSPIGRKQEFLQRKGLTEEEIKRAFKLASIDITIDQNVNNSKDYTVIPIPQGYMYPCFQQIYPCQITIFQRIKEFFNATALIGVTIYCVYWFYKVLLNVYDTNVILKSYKLNILYCRNLLNHCYLAGKRKIV